MSAAKLPSEHAESSQLSLDSRDLADMSNDRTNESLVQNGPVTPPSKPNPRESFKRKMLEIRDETVDVETSQEWFEEALKTMDQALLSKLKSAGSPPSVESLNLFLKGWGSGDPGSHESYRVTMMGKNPPWYVLTAKAWEMSIFHIYCKFSQGEQYRLTQINPATMPNYREGGGSRFEFYAIEPQSDVFLTPFSRSESRFASYAIWRLDGREFKQLWNSGKDFLSIVTIRDNGVVFSRCVSPPTTDEEGCTSTVTVHYEWSNGSWKELGP